MNDENLKKGKATQFKSGENAAENGRKGGLAAAEERRKRKRLCELVKFIAQCEVENENGESITYEELSVLTQWRNAANGDLDALKWLEKVMGEEFSFLEVDNDL